MLLKFTFVMNFNNNIMNMKCKVQKDYSSDTVLFSAIKSGDEHAFSRFYDKNLTSLYNYGAKFTSDAELLKDCIHDVFVKFYIKRNDFSHIENLGSYLFISLKNKLCDESRRRVHTSDKEVETLNVYSGFDTENDFLDAEMEFVISNKIKLLLSKITPRQREALTLYYLEEKDYKEICMIMNMNYQSVRNLIHRGLLKLRKICA